ncbi:MAG: intradiol ring-cleavage dioxygenase [Candidatus Rokubacteria bacterium]|nr:intradiol ring-cleavage dioxygenase [Candidatus Rokubacteria bacterium]
MFIGPIRACVAIVVVLAPAFPATAQRGCAPTAPDMLGPFYVPNAPERASTGKGFTVSGVVRTAGTCAPVPNARLEWWAANPRGDYDDAHRATQTADATGRYTYETDFPGKYSGRPLHLHVRVSAPGHNPLVTQIYPKAGATRADADFVLIP